MIPDDIPIESGSSALEPFIIKARYDGRPPKPCPRIFGTLAPHEVPRLRPNRVNRILVFPGCFNPPHLGHKQLLHHAFNESSCALDIIAAIIIPLGDGYAYSKDAGKSISFLNEERNRLWRGPSAQLFDWAWVYDGTMDEWKYFRSLLFDTVATEGFKIDWTVLYGGDQIDLTRRIELPNRGCSDVVISNVTRVCDFFDEKSSVPINIPQCSVWQPLSLSPTENGKFEEEVLVQILSTLAFQYPDYANLCDEPEFIELVNQIPQYLKKRENNIFFCNLTYQPYSTIYFIRVLESNLPKNRNISSTKIRSILCRRKNTPDDELIDKLEPLVENPQHLLDMASSRKKDKRD